MGNGNNSELTALEVLTDLIMSETHIMSLKRRKKLLTKKVVPQWYQRYMNILPPIEQVFLQPIKELKEEDKMLREAKPIVKSEDKTKELVKALENEKAMKIEMVLDLVAGDPKKMRERVALIKPSTNPIKYVMFHLTGHYSNNLLIPSSMGTDQPSTNPIKYMQDKKKEAEAAAQFQYTDNEGNPLTFTQYLKFMRTNRLKPNSKWRLLVHNNVVKHKMKDLIKLRYQQQIAQKWKKAIRRVRAVLRFFQIIANIARTTTEVFKKFRQLTESKNDDPDNKFLVFDKYLFKSHSGGRDLDTEILFNLGKPEHYRTWEEAEKTAHALKFIRSFSALPQHYQERLAMIAWYMEVPADKVIIREGHVADSFYFLITGKVLAVKLTGSPVFEHRSKFTVLKVFEKDEIIGEGISNRSHRSYSVTSIVKCTLLSINIDDYYRIFNYCGSPDENPEHIRLLRKGIVITPDSSKSHYIYVVKSGTCRVMTMVKPLNTTKHYKCIRVSLPPVKAVNRPTVVETYQPVLPECKIFPGVSEEVFNPIVHRKKGSIDVYSDNSLTDDVEVSYTPVHWAVAAATERSVRGSNISINIESPEDKASEGDESETSFDLSWNKSPKYGDDDWNNDDKTMSRDGISNNADKTMSRTRMSQNVAKTMYESKILNNDNKVTSKNDKISRLKESKCVPKYHVRSTEAAHQNTFCNKLPEKKPDLCSSESTMVHPKKPHPIIYSNQSIDDNNSHQYSTFPAMGDSKQSKKNGLSKTKNGTMESFIPIKSLKAKKSEKRNSVKAPPKKSLTGQYIPGSTLSTSVSISGFCQNPVVLQKMAHYLPKAKKSVFSSRR
ncbi:hypothetical protein Btru_073333 [Bulinus truncatus]|nr:hypothetical protein Btru_073333 [Bulinus truncatus]